MYHRINYASSWLPTKKVYLILHINLCGYPKIHNKPFLIYMGPCLRQRPHENKNRSTHHPHSQISSNSSTIATDNSMGMYIIHYSIEHIEFSVEYTLLTTIVILI
jgi:hypothetical protein